MQTAASALQTQELIASQKEMLAKQPHLAMQDIGVDVGTLTPLTP